MMHRKFNENEIFISGYAKLPSNITASKLYEVIALVVLVDKKTGKILEAECTLSTRLGRDFVNYILIGKNINDVEKISKEMDEKYFGTAQKAVVTAFKNCKKKYDSITF